MTDISGPFDGSPWAETEWSRHMPAAMPSGVIGSPGAAPTAGPLSFSSSGLNFTIGVGDANVGGQGFSRTGSPAAQAVTANGNATLARRDRVVLRRSLGTHDVTVTRIQGTPAGTPAAPPIVRDATTFDEPLFSFLVPANNGTVISGVIDERLFISADNPGKLTVYSMANRPTVRLSPGMEVVDSTVGRAWRYDGTYWRNELAGNHIPAGTPAGAYITGIQDSSVVALNASSIGTVPLGRTFSAPPDYVQVTPGDTAGNLGLAISGRGSHTTTSLAIVCRSTTGATLPNATTVRLNWLAVGYNT